ncbi:MAG: EamA family transporter [Nanobdellota archaeon]
MLQGFGALLFSSAYMLFSRFILAKKHFEHKRYIALTYIIGTVMLLLGFRYFDLTYMTWLSGGLILVIIATAILADLFFYHGLEHTKVEKVEPLFLSNWVFTVILAVIVYPSERDILKVALALIAAITILVVNLRKHHLRLDRYSVYILIAAVILGIHNNILKTLLEHYNPFTLYLLIMVGGSLIMPFLFKLKLKEFKRKGTPLVVLATVFTIARWLFLYWSYQVIGVVSTSLIMTAAPIVEVWGSSIFLKERLHKKYVIGTIIIALCIAASFMPNL